MGSFRESQTAHNLLLSYSAETQAQTRYSLFAEQARDEGLIQISRLFEETAAQEYEHARRFFKFFNGGELTISGTFPAGVVKETHANLLASAALEAYVHDQMYRVFAEVALAEGYGRAAETFTAINVAEKNHELMFLELADNLATGRAFQRSETLVWKCLSCGYLHTGKTPPEKCPACVKPMGYFEILRRNW
ncbi:MAG: rubrerythrin family protein [Desulforhopalus sp.]|jgi:rubrerythrin|nr:rubrerythrin family protein [Desulforhopalus sp.]